jgi:hypothetical protein
LSRPFDIERAKTYLRENPQSLHVAVIEGFKGDGKPQYLAAVTDCKQELFGAVEKEFLRPEYLEPFKSRVESTENFAGFTKGEARNLKNAMDKRVNDVETALDMLDSNIRLYIVNHFIGPLEKLFKSSEQLRSRIHQLMIKQTDDFRLPKGLPSINEEDALKGFFMRIKSASLNASSQFMAMVRLIPIVYKERFKEKISKEKFLEAVSNIKNLIEQYARMHLGHFHIFRDEAWPIWEAVLARIDQYGKGDDHITRAYNYDANDTAPAYEIYRPDNFALIDTAEGLQIVNNEKALERFHNAILSRKSEVLDQLKLAEESPAVGCPALRVKFIDGKNLVEFISEWLSKVVAVHLVPTYERLKVFAK